MVTRQHRADAALQQWQSLRRLPPDERIEMLMADFFREPVESAIEYQITLDRVAAEMAHAQI